MHAEQMQIVTEIHLVFRMAAKSAPKEAIMLYYHSSYRTVFESHSESFEESTLSVENG